MQLEAQLGPQNRNEDFTEGNSQVERRSFLLVALGSVLGGGLIAACGSSGGTIGSTAATIPTGSQTGSVSFRGAASNDTMQSVSFSGTIAGKTLTGTAQIPAGEFFVTSLSGDIAGTPFTLVISTPKNDKATVSGTYGSSSVSATLRPTDSGADFSATIGDYSVNGSWAFKGGFATPGAGSKQEVSTSFNAGLAHIG